MAIRSLSKAQRRLLQGLKPAGGRFDRYYRVVSEENGEHIAGFQCTTALWAFRHELVQMSPRRRDVLVLTTKGRIMLRRPQLYG